MNPLLTTYLPVPADVPAASVLEARRLLTILWGLYLPDIDTRPNSVIGDSFVAGAAAVMAAGDIAAERLRSDMDPENVANNIIYDCAFVEAFLANFGVYAPSAIGTAGYIRLVFDTLPAGGTLEVARHLRFRFATDDEYQLRLPAPGPLLLSSPGYPLSGGTNSLPLVQTGSSSWSVVVAVESSVVADIRDSTAATVSIDLDGLQSAAGYGFSSQDVAVGLPALARKTRTTAYAATPTTANGIRRFADVEMPGVLAIAAASPGDPEQLRAGLTSLGFPAPAVDIYIRGRRGFREESQLVKLSYDATAQRFVGLFEPVSTPQLMRTVYWEGNPLVVLDPTIWMKSSTRLPGVQSAGSGEESYWISLPMPIGDDDAEVVSISPGEGGSHAWFVVTYLADSEVRSARELLTSGDWKLFGADAAVLPFRVVEIEALIVHYKRRPGTRVLLDTARTEIAANINGTNYPSPLSTAPWIDSMVYAGAETVIDFEVAAELRWGIAEKLLVEDSDPSEDYDEALASCIPLEPFLISSTDELTPAYVDPDLGTADATFSAAGPRNVTWYIRPESISFVEI